jgi:hypothetical protein
MFGLGIIITIYANDFESLASRSFSKIRRPCRLDRTTQRMKPVLVVKRWCADIRFVSKICGRKDLEYTELSRWKWKPWSIPHVASRGENNNVPGDRVAEMLPTGF